MIGRCAIFLISFLFVPLATKGGEAEILRDLRAWHASTDDEQRRELARRIERDAGFDRRRLSEWLHRIAELPEHEPGRFEMDVDAGHGQSRRVTVRIPRGYDAAKRWPVIYALHPSGSNGRLWIDYLERILGRRIDEFLVVAPTGYRQTGLDAPPPFTRDHAAILREVKREFHVDSNRVHALGYSLGGYAAWAVALFHSELFASIVPMGAAFTVPPSDDGLWRLMLPNFRHVPVLWVWGGADAHQVTGIDGKSIGGIAVLNRKFLELTREENLPITTVVIPGRGHNDFMEPPPRALTRILSARRVELPRRVERTFRHLHQGSVYWLEAETWNGPSWGNQTIASHPEKGESSERALGRAIAPRLGMLAGEIEGQTIRIRRRNIGSMVVWIEEGMIDWKKPLVVEIDGRRIFEGVVAPDLHLALSEAARTGDLDRLRWARIRIDG
ncbi:MAG TPA: alpha/beta hydrolase-fold protein [Thermoanaerobaculia bacterium]|nr:alpha/beta hydrolase-fold protein [Thermoanaerobaculia bacterium]